MDMNTNDRATSAALPVADYGTGVVIPLSEIDFEEDDDDTLSDEAIWNRWSPESQATGVMGSPRVSSSIVEEVASCEGCQNEENVRLMEEAWRLWKTGDESGPQVISTFLTEDMLVDTATIDPLCRCEPGLVDCAADCPQSQCRAQYAAQHGG